MFKRFLGPAAIPLLGALIALSSWYLTRLGLDPWAVLKASYASSYGIEAVLLLFTVGLIEAIFPLCHYFPGTALFILLLGAANHQASPLVVIGVTVCGIAVGLIVSYCAANLVSNLRITKQFEYLENFVRWARAKYGVSAEILLAFHPNHLGLLFFLYGLAKVDVFWSLVRSVLASVVWVAAYHAFLGSVVVQPSEGGGRLQLGVGIALLVIGIGLGLRGLSRRT